jgi:outer membrane protein OmpA-like peptidoglycan-associated protein
VILAVGLCLAGAAIVATRASVNPSADNSQVHISSLDISEAQGILQHEGYLAPGGYRKGEADEATVVALRNFQADHTLRLTGAIDYETTTQLLSHQGMPVAEPLFGGRARLILEGVQFDTDTAHLKSSSRVTLDRVARSLNAWPGARVEIDGHTDSTNTDAYNRTLSKARSAAVCEYLVDQGVASSRLEEKGFGESRPIANNATAVGRATNRRVELVRID